MSDASRLKCVLSPWGSPGTSREDQAAHGADGRACDSPTIRAAASSGSRRCKLTAIARTLAGGSSGGPGRAHAPLRAFGVRLNSYWTRKLAMLWDDRSPLATLVVT